MKQSRNSAINIQHYANLRILGESVTAKIIKSESASHIEIGNLGTCGVLLASDGIKRSNDKIWWVPRHIFHWSIFLFLADV